MRALILAVFVALPSSALANPQADAIPDGPKITLQKLGVVRDLRCQKLQQAHDAKVQADIARGEITSVRPNDRLFATRKVGDAEGKRAGYFEEAGRLRRRLEAMAEKFTAAKRKEWYAIEDEAERIRIEELIIASKDIVERECGE